MVLFESGINQHDEWESNECSLFLLLEEP